MRVSKREQAFLIQLWNAFAGGIKLTGNPGLILFDQGGEYAPFDKVAAKSLVRKKLARVVNAPYFPAIQLSGAGVEYAMDNMQTFAKPLSS